MDDIRQQYFVEGVISTYRVAKTHWMPLSCRSFPAKEPLIIGLFCGKWRIKMRHPMTLRHPVPVGLILKLLYRVPASLFLGLLSWGDAPRDCGMLTSGAFLYSKDILKFDSPHIFYDVQTARQWLWCWKNMNESGHTWMSHVTYEWDMSHMNWVMTHMNESCHIWMGHVTYECRDYNEYALMRNSCVDLCSSLLCPVASRHPCINHFNHSSPTIPHRL